MSPGRQRVVHCPSAPSLPSCVGALPLPLAAVSSLSFSAWRARTPGQRPPRHSCEAESLLPAPGPCACSVFAHSRPCPFPSFSSLVNASSLQEGTACRLRSVQE